MFHFGALLLLDTYYKLVLVVLMVLPKYPLGIICIVLFLTYLSFDQIFVMK